MRMDLKKSARGGWSAVTKHLNLLFEQAMLWICYYLFPSSLSSFPCLCRLSVESSSWRFLVTLLASVSALYLCDDTTQLILEWHTAARNSNNTTPARYPTLVLFGGNPERGTFCKDRCVQRVILVRRWWLIVRESSTSSLGFKEVSRMYVTACEPVVFQNDIFKESV